jgi:type II secretory pathway component PulJ
MKRSRFKKYIKQRGVSLTEALVSILISTIVMGATYAIYNNFQSTFVRQINHNNLKQEARFALHVLQYDSRMAGFKHPDSIEGEIQMPVKVTNDDGTEVADDTEFGEKVSFCFDTENVNGGIQRKLIQYELKIPYGSLTEKTVLKKKIWNTTNCDVTDTDNTTVDVEWMPVAQFFKTMGIRLRSKHIDFELQLETADDKIRETYTASSFMRNLNFGGKSYYVYDEEDLHENRTPVIPFTGSLIVQCASNLTRDIQLANFLTSSNTIILHQGETVGGTSLTRTYDAIRFETEKPPPITGLPSLSHDQMRLKLITTTVSSDLPPGLTAASGFMDQNSNSTGDAGEWDGSLILSGTLESVDTNYTFNSDGYEDFTIRVQADLNTNCDSLGWENQNEAYKDYTVRVMKYSAPQFSDVNLHTWDPKGMTYGDSNYERRGVGSANGGPFYDKTQDGRSFYIQQNLATPSFLVSKDQYDSFVLKGMVCSGGYPDCNPQMTAWHDDDMVGFAAGYQRPSVIQKTWPDNKIRACAGVNFQGLNGTSGFDENRLRNSLRSNERSIWNGLSSAEKNSWFGEPADMVYDMYLWSWWGASGNQSAIHLHQFKGYQHTQTRNCGYSEGSYSSHSNISQLTGWSTPNSSQMSTFNEGGYNRLFARFDNDRPTNSGDRNCSNRTKSYSQISFNPGATHQTNCSWGKNTGVKNTVTLTYHPNKFRINIENKPFLANTTSQRFTAFDLRFDANGDLKDHTNTAWPYMENSSPSSITLPTAANASEDLKTTSFKRFQKGSVAISSYSQPDNRFSNIQIARLPRFIPIRSAANKPIPKAQNLYFFMDEDYQTINKIYGLLSKAYDPSGEHLEVLVDASTCAAVSGIGTAETGSLTSETVDGATRSMDCRLSGNWRATTAVWANNSELPNIGEMYDTANKSSYAGSRATVSTTAGGTMFVFADGSFRYQTLPADFNDGNAHTDSFYYAVQSEDTSNARISNIKKVYIGYNIANTAPTGVSFKEEDETAITVNTNFDIAEDDNKDKIVGEIYTTSIQEPDTHDFVRFNLGQVPNTDTDKDVDHGSRFRLEQKDNKFYLILNDDTDIRWANLPTNKKYFSIRIIATDLRGNQLATTEKVYINRVDCSETAMENILIYKTKAAMTIEGYIQGREGEKVFRRQTVPFTSNLDEAVITFDFPERSVQPSIKIAEQTIQVGGVSKTIGMLSNKCKDTHSFIDRQQLWSN